MGDYCQLNAIIPKSCEGAYTTIIGTGGENITHKNNIKDIYIPDGDNHVIIYLDEARDGGQYIIEDLIGCKIPYILINGEGCSYSPGVSLYNGKDKHLEIEMGEIHLPCLKFELTLDDTKLLKTVSLDVLGIADKIKELQEFHDYLEECKATISEFVITPGEEKS